MPEAVLNPDPNAGSGGGGINIVNKSALLPDVGPLGSIADVDDTFSNGKISLYVVKKGDNLSQIAKMFGISVNTIIWANNLKRGNLIKPGQKLIILPITGVRYKVRKGDTIASIAKRFKGDIKEVLDYNGLSIKEELTVGQEIIIPDGELSYSSKYHHSHFRRSRLRGVGGPNYPGYYLRPIKGGRKTQGLHGYNAVDLANYCGAPIFAAAPGDVIIARSHGWNGGYGKYVVISHPNGTQTLYAHMSKIVVTRGWHVARGQVIGYEGTTGKSTGCHVHFEVRGARNPF